MEKCSSNRYIYVYLGALAELRNKAMAPLYTQQKQGVNYSQILFINDVIFCVTDILELIYNHVYQESHLTCGLDFVWMKILNDHIFYDNWVTRNVHGERLWDSVFRWRYEFLRNDTIGRQRWEDGLPFQVYGCWNGMVVLETEPFYKGVVFRRNVDKKECSASECSLMSRDFWNLGFGRALVVPSVKIVYWVEAHEKVCIVDLGSSRLSAIRCIESEFRSN